MKNKKTKKVKKAASKKPVKSTRKPKYNTESDLIGGGGGGKYP